ncbi:hypothetical protein ABE504_14255 [Paenibacillus oryzisoli]|uniref:hypothetical protein n=1 Tax=Paenibacillus oryzisoli TaxID=1850517 RepID=UPI003D2D1207
MESIRNSAFYLQFSDRGYVDKLLINQDKEKMNWVIDQTYLQQVGYSDEDKLFGQFGIMVNQAEYDSSRSEQPIIQRIRPNLLKIFYSFELVDVHMTYDGENDDESLRWTISLFNRTKKEMSIEGFTIWASLAYVMFRDADLKRNIEHSCAVFPSISKNFTKLGCVRRSNSGPHLGVYAVSGETKSVGTYCRFENNFFKNVSPSLDGMLYHQLVLAGTGSTDPSANVSDWIYMRDEGALRLDPNGSAEWSFVLKPYTDKQQFYEHAYKLGHPVVDYDPVTVCGGLFKSHIKLPNLVKPTAVWIESFEANGIRRHDLTELLEATEQGYQLELRMERPGERKLVISLESGLTDWVVFNVIEPVKEIIEARVDYVCNSLYQDENTETPHAFLPVSNQGESLGKLVLVLMKNEMGRFEQEQVRKVENSAVQYIKPKWFVNGDFYSPAKLYGSFYRIIDLDYIGHIYYLLSKFSADQLTHGQPLEYLQWAAEIMIVRLDEALHEDVREKEETKMLGVYILFIKQLLQDLERNHLTKEYNTLSRLWTASGERIRKETVGYKGAVTEHFYDNAGFGPTCEALCLLGHNEEASRYGELLLANIGYSNDFRAQNPDRWWESLSYMIHSLWGGMVAASTLVAYEQLRANEYLLASYRSTMPVFYCYDWHATATTKKLEKGQAASTYSVAGPNLNRPDLSRNRFGQSAFAKDGGLFEQLFSQSSGDDWDMGEELAAYLAGFGTKCFLYYRDGEVCCVNGEIIDRDDGSCEVTSYAAYPRQFHFFEEQVSFFAEQGQEVRTVIWSRGTFSLPSQTASLA